MKIDLTLSDKSKQILSKMPDVVVPALHKGMTASMLLAERTSKQLLSGKVLNRRSGRLRSSIDTETRIDGNRVVGKISTNVIYGRIHELGGVIRPKTANLLRFQIPGVGWRSAKKVVIPKRPYLRPALEDNTGEISKLLSGRIVEAFEEI
nr:hypothetical protein 4 [bacterium]